MADELLLIFAGEEGPPVRLGDCFRQMHAEAYERQLETQAARERLGVGGPTEEATWTTSLALADALRQNVEARDADKARQTVRDVARALEDAPVAVAAVPTVPAHLDRLEVVMAAMSEVDKRRLGSRVAHAYQSYAAERRKNDPDDAALAALDSALYEAQRAVVVKTVTRVRGLQRRDKDGKPVDAGEQQMTEALCDALQSAGVFSVLFMVADRFQVLPPGKAARFGRPQPST